MRLILMRHAKSSWDDFTQPDHSRPLNDRGRRNARALGAWLRSNDYLPDKVLCSTATRTRETLDLLELGASVVYPEDLYHASPETLLRSLQGASGNTVLILGHNPGIGSFASRVVAHRPDHPRFGAYPTGATLVASFDIPRWADLSLNSGTVDAFITPRDLAEQP
ncbi:SixA phosphatase family protein [Primorskyibacter flagellatus]|uniref:Phosphohistidine phosphatase n=1 Tax=Primorskyibacter flagellatus TaxID=1387277 RepID=A0A1W1ZMX6_9RHOB|nr:histidine phosphatase family protein [Primorskyibacter flagellatus]SMC49717.1 phosphohistidine phosphatase [Primorskyibacter flagellatus]